MTFSRPLAGLLIAAGTLAAACGSSDVSNRDYGQPPDAGQFNPGNGGADGYGSGSQTASFVCPDELKACDHVFTFPFNNENTVELRGDYGGQETWETGTAMVHDGDVWKASVHVPYGKPVQYKFIVNGAPTWVVDPTSPTVTDSNNNTNNTFAGTTCEPSICAEEGALPPGVFDWRDSTIYFAFVDRFNNGNTGNDCHVNGVSGAASDYQGGDWAGVTAKINDNYFTNLGINTLWITVPFDNPNVTGLGTGGDNHQYSGYHGYWPNPSSDNPSTLSTESCFGSMADLKALVDAAHTKGLKVLFDYAMVHVHSGSGLYGAHNNWFWPNDNGHGGNCICGEGCSWDTVPEREHCWFTSYLPHWNYTNADARNYGVSNAVEWIKQTGVDGFRADAIKHVDMSWLTAVRAKIKSDIIATQTPQQRFYMVGETYDFGNRDLIKNYVDPNTKLDGQFDFPLRQQVVNNVIMRLGSMNDLANFMNGNDYFYGASAVMSTFIGNHDLPRIIHLAADNRIWGDNQGADGKDRAWGNQPGAVGELSAYERVANGFAVLFTNRGAPLVYYGDEIGLPGAGDPDNRRFMQWSGYNANQTYLHDRVAKLLDIRSKHPALRRGTRTTLSVDADMWVYSRVTTGDTVYVAINRSDAPKTANLPAGTYDELVDGGNTTVPARQTRIFVAK